MTTAKKAVEKEAAFPELPEFIEIKDEELEKMAPSLDEAIEQATKDLQNKINDLIQQIYYKEQEIDRLKLVIEEQANNYTITVSNLIYEVFGPKQ